LLFDPAVMPDGLRFALSGTGSPMYLRPFIYGLNGTWFFYMCWLFWSFVAFLMEHWLDDSPEVLRSYTEESGDVLAGDLNGDHGADSTAAQVVDLNDFFYPVCGVGCL
jgi:hypothetical protein